jgi:menaquinone-dependent protoporphyrinogen oxidase
VKILVTVATRHGSTGEIGEIVASVLRDAGHTVETQSPEKVIALDGFDAVVLGSAVYAGRWLQSARAFVDRHATGLVARPVWLYSSGPIGDPPMPEGEPPEVVALVDRLAARAHRSFAGRLDHDRLGPLERTITTVLRAPDGDFRDWDAIRRWADEIARELSPREVPA